MLWLGDSFVCDGALLSKGMFAHQGGKIQRMATQLHSPNEDGMKVAVQFITILCIIVVPF